MKLLIADDHDLLREALVEYLCREIEVEIDEVGTLEAALALFATDESKAYDLVLLDYNMPGMDGLSGLSTAIGAHRGPVALMSGVASIEVAEEALEAGAAGFIPKTLGLRSMMNAIAFMCAGEQFAPVRWMRESHKAIANKEDVVELTERERQVLSALCEGKSNKEIARWLDLQEVTIKLHVKTLSRKLNAKNRTQAAILGRELGLA